MKVNYYFRRRSQGNNSIENIFQAVIQKLPTGIQLETIVASKTFDLKTLLSLRHEHADVHHITGAVNYFALTLPGRKTILTVHDIGFYENPVNGFWKQMLYGVLWFRLPLKRVRLVTVVSQFTKNKLIERFGLDENKIRIIGNPVLAHFHHQPIRLPGERMSILHIGSGDHKNFKGLLKAAEGLHVHIIKIGRISPEEQQLIGDSISLEQHFELSNETVNELYGKVDILYFASLYEGFGMPIIEAQTVGRPVITSNFGAMKEVARDSALLVNPEDPNEIRKAILSLWNDKARYTEMVERGRRNAARFSLDEIASQYTELYYELAHA